MARRSKRNRPSSPAEILARNALQRGAKAKQARDQRRNPQMWGVAEGIELLPANEDLVVVREAGRKSRIRHARRSDAFALVSLSAEQERAAAAYLKDWMTRAGARLGDPLQRPAVDSSHADGPGREDFMIDAGARIERVHREMGRASARLLEALVEPLAMRGEVRVWRVVVHRLTGETERHAQAASVRMACQELHLAYEAIDKEDRDMRGARRNSAYAGGGDVN